MTASSTMFAPYKGMRRILLSLSILFFSCTLWGQGSGLLLDKISQISSVTLEYTLTTNASDGRLLMEQRGTIDIQKMSYRLTSDLLIIISDGTTRWLYSPKSEELVICSADYSSEDPLENPFSLLASTSMEQKKDGTFKIVHKGANGYVYTVLVNSVSKKETPWDDSYFILNVDSLSEDVIITDLR